jgi:non-specific serine/threonine protein kinase/serine/threonine-protein kinase
MGLVYLAEQTMPFRRQVALKVVKPLRQHSAHLLARFAAERQTLATLNHTGISKIFDAGATEDGRPYVAMEYVDGLPLIRFCDEHRLTITDRLNLFLQVCAAVQHAHQKGVIHRDIKPSNLLVGSVDGSPAVKVIDFGIAKALQPSPDDETFLTQTGTILGTPEYMSPEQVTSGGDVDTRTDVYALGVVLYELLIGVRPFEVRGQRSSSPLTLLELVREQDPPKLSTRLRGLDDQAAATAASRRTDVRNLARHVRGELEWITLRALEKLPAQRFQSAAELGADVERYLKGEPADWPRDRRRGASARGVQEPAPAVAATSISGMSPLSGRRYCRCDGLIVANSSRRVLIASGLPV